MQPEDLRSGGCMAGRFPSILPVTDAYGKPRRGRGTAVPVRPPTLGRARSPPAAGVQGRDRRRVARRAVAAVTLREERAAAARRLGRSRRRRVLRRPRARPGRAGHDVAAGPAADAQHDGADRGAEHRLGVRRPGPPLHAAGPLRPRPRLAVAPAGHPRLAARAGDVGGRGADPPLPDQGAGRDPAHLPAVLRALHPDGPRRQLDAAGREAEVRRRSRSTGWTR